MLNGPASVGRTGLGLPPGSPLTLLALGNDREAAEDLGDQNRGREDQGQIIISSTSFSNYSQWGVRLDDTNAPTSPRNCQPLTHRGYGRYGIDQQHFQCQPGGGVTIIGDASTAAQPVVNAPVGRIITTTRSTARATMTMVFALQTALRQPF